MTDVRLSTAGGRLILGILRATSMNATVSVGIKFTVGGNTGFSSCMHFTFSIAIASPKHVIITGAVSTNSCSTFSVRFTSCRRIVRDYLKLALSRFVATYGRPKNPVTLCVISDRSNR